MKIAIAGLGKMGGQIAVKLKNQGFEVTGYDLDQVLTEHYSSEGITPSLTQSEVISFFKGEPVVLWLMIPAEYVSRSIKEWATQLPRGSILIDGGNTDYRSDKNNASILAKKGIRHLDVGTSGGIWGLENGFSMMIGGDETAFKEIEPIFKTLSLPKGGYEYFGESGSGHYVKMVHNAIEYGMMESLAEGYQILRFGPYKNLDLVKAGTVWQKGSVINSWLNDLTVKVLKEDTELKDIPGVVAESGEARWALETATEKNIPSPAIRASFNVRLDSQAGQVDYRTKLLAAMRNQFGGHSTSGQ